MLNRPVSFSGGNDQSQKPHLALDVSTIQGSGAGDKDACPRCGGLVFHAEKMLSKNAVSESYGPEATRETHELHILRFELYNLNCNMFLWLLQLLPAVNQAGL